MTAAQYQREARRCGGLRAAAESAGDVEASARYERKELAAWRAAEGAAFAAIGGAS